MNKISQTQAREALSTANEQFIELFRHGSLNVEFYKPDKQDLQQPHSRDEIYVVASGSGWFVDSGERCRFTTGDVIFVAAGKEHRFEDFSEDFATWVFFYGPEGGEAPKPEPGDRPSQGR